MFMILPKAPNYIIQERKNHNFYYLKMQSDRAERHDF